MIAASDARVASAKEAEARVQDLIESRPAAKAHLGDHLDHLHWLGGFARMAEQEARSNARDLSKTDEQISVSVKDAEKQMRTFIGACDYLVDYIRWKTIPRDT
jgi:hypothetical protein